MLARAGKTFFQEGVLAPFKNSESPGSSATISPASVESIVRYEAVALRKAHMTRCCSFDGHEYVLKELSECTLEEWLKRVVAVVAQVLRASYAWHSFSFCARRWTTCRALHVPPDNVDCRATRGSSKTFIRKIRFRWQQRFLYAQLIVSCL
jgi:hypothetical protein